MTLMASIGLVWIIKDSLILKSPRNYISSKSKWLEELLSCSQCLGFWVGLCLAYFEYTFIGFDFYLLYLPFISSGFCWFFDSTLDLIQEASVYFTKKRNES